MTDLAKLVVKLEAQSAQLTAELTKAKGQLRGFETSTNELAARIGKGIGLATAGAAAGFALMLKNSIDTADELSKLSQKVGISTEELSKLQYAAKLSDVDTAALQQGLAKLSKSAVDAAAGTGEAKEAFKALGINVKDAQGNVRSSAELFGDLADAFEKFQDGPEKTAAALAIFGRAGADLIPLLNGGRDGLKQAGDELQRFGGVVSTQAGKKAEDFNDSLTRLSAAASGLANQVAKQLLPAMTDISDQVVNYTKNSDAAAVASKVLLTAFQAVTVFGANLAYVIKGVYTEIETFGAQLFALGKLDFKGFAAIRQFAIEDAEQARKQIDAFSESILNIGKTVKQAGANAPQVQAPADSSKATLKYADALTKTGSAAKVARDGLNQYDIQLDLHQRLLQEQEEREKGAADAAAQLAEQGQRVFEQTRTQAESYAASIENLLVLLQRGAITQDTFDRAIEKSKSQFDQSAKAADKWADQLRGAAEQAGAAVQKSLADFIFDPFKDGLDGLVSGFAQTLRRIAAELAASALIRSLATAGAAGSFGPLGVGVAGALTLAGFADGGRPPVGVPSMVGEAGPELFVPDVSGTIIPNHELMANQTPAPVNLRVVNAFDTSVIDDYWNSAAGERTFTNLVTRNGTKIRNALAAT